MNIPPDQFDPNEKAVFGKSDDTRSTFKDGGEQQAAPAATVATTAEDGTPAADQAESGRDEEGRIPVKRFNKVFRERTEYKAQLEEAMTELERFRSTHAPASAPQASAGEPATWWTKLYGTDQNAQAGWQVYQDATSAQQQAMIERTLEAVAESQTKRSQVVSQSEDEIQETIETLEASIGATLTAKQKEDIMEIVDDLVPKDDDGYYLHDPSLHDFEKGYEFYQLKHPQAAKTNTERSRIASLTSGSASGSPASGASLPPLQPNNWGAWRQQFRK